MYYLGERGKLEAPCLKLTTTDVKEEQGMRTKQLLNYFWLFIWGCLASMAVAEQPAIGISLHSKSPEKAYDGSMYCNLYFSIHNNSAPGTIESIDVPVDVFDDRGRKVDLNMMANKINNKGDGFLAKRAPIAVGETMLRTEEVWAQEECQYIGNIQIGTDEIKNSDCSIRMWPEGLDCSSMVGSQEQ